MTRTGGTAKSVSVAGSTDKLVCTAVQNAGVGAVTGFQITIQMDGVTLPGGRYAAGRVAPGRAGEMCARMALPITGPHQLSAIVDESHAVPEYVETNNTYVETISIARTEGGQGQTAPAPTPTPAADQADLTVSAIKVNGKTPGGSGDGKSGISAVIKNAGKNTGARDADSFVVWLVVDGDQGNVIERSVSGLKDGQEREVRFEDVRLKKGDHTLTVTVDPKDAVTESNKGNNMLDTTVSCSDDR